MSNRGKGEEPGLDEPGPIHFGAGDDRLSDEPGPIRFGGGKPIAPKITPSPQASDAEFDFENGPTIALPSYITRAAQSWDPDSPARAKARREAEPKLSPAVAPPPAFKAPAEPIIEPPPAPEPPPPRIEAPPPPPEEEPPRAYEPPPRRRTVPRPEPTYGVFRETPEPAREPPAQAEGPKRYFTPLPEQGRALVVSPPPPPPPPPPPVPVEIEPVAAEPQKPLIQIQINGMPTLFKGNGLMRGLFFGCLVGVAVGGIAAVLLDLLSPHPAPPPPLYEPPTAEVLNNPVEAQPEPKAQRKGAKGYPRTVTNTVVEPPPSIQVQSAPAPRAMIRPGSGQPLQADPNAR